MKHFVGRSLLITLAAALAAPFLCAQVASLKLWPAGAPGEKESIGPEELTPPKDANQVYRLTNVSEPRIEVYPPESGKNAGAAVLVCPGGGYNILAFEHEGEQVVKWLNSIGVTGVLLKYRVPRRKGREKHHAPLEDAQRAMSLVRKHAAQWGVDPNRIGMLGFSAGGHLTLTAGMNFDRRSYPTDPAIDDFSCRPDFLVAIYPAYLVEKNDGGALPPEIRVNERTPPTFFVHADDDQHSAEGSARVYVALKHAGLPSELHIYVKGGHGFGMLKSDLAVASWPQRCEEWMRAMGFLEKR